MVPPGATVQSLNNLLQRDYIPGMTRQFNDSFPNLRYIRLNTEDINTEGEKAIMAIETGLNEAGGFHGESATVPSASSPTVKNVEVSLKQMTFRGRISWRLMKKARTNRNAFARSYDLNMRSTRDAMTLTANQYLWGDGSGVQCRVSASAAGPPASITLNRKYGLTTGGQPYGIIRPNQVLHLLDTKGWAVGTIDSGTFKVLTVDDSPTDGTIICTVLASTGSDIADVNVDDYVYLQNSIAGWLDDDETVDNSPCMGLLGLYDHTLVDPLQGQAVADEPMWKGESVTVQQNTVISDMNKLKTKFQKRQPKGRTLYYISTHESRDRWHDRLVNKVEWRNVSSLDGSWEVAMYGGRPWFADHTAPDGIVFAVPGGGVISRYSASDFIEVVDNDNSTLHMVDGKTVFDFYLTTLYEAGTKRRNVLHRAVGLTW